MVTHAPVETVQSFDVRHDILVAAPQEVVWQAILDEAGSHGKMPNGGAPMNLTIEPWVGGRWFRDLGNKSGHLWGHVQVIKPPSLLELCGPMWMSYAAISHVQYRLTKEGSGTRVSLIHRAMGLFLPEHGADGVNKGWPVLLNNIKEYAESKLRSGAAR